MKNSKQNLNNCNFKFNNHHNSHFKQDKIKINQILFHSDNFYLKNYKTFNDEILLNSILILF